MLNELKQNPPQILTEMKPLQGAEALVSSLLAACKKELITLARYPVSFVASFAQVFLIVAIFSLAGQMFSQPGSASLVVNGVVVYGFILFIFLSDTLWTIGANIRQEQVQGTLEQLYLSPANKFANLASKIINLLTLTMILSLISMGVMSWMLGGLPFHNPLLGLYIFVMTLSGVFGFGFAFAALTLRIKQTAETLANLLQFAVMILCANFFPFSALPEPLRLVSRLIPLSYSVDAFRSTLMGFPAGFPELAPIEVELVIVTLFGLLTPMLGYWAYIRAENTARRSGSLAEF